MPAIDEIECSINENDDISQDNVSVNIPRKKTSEIFSERKDTTENNRDSKTSKSNNKMPKSPLDNHNPQKLMISNSKLNSTIPNPQKRLSNSETIIVESLKGSFQQTNN